MKDYFKLDPYHNIYTKSSLVDNLKKELLNNKDQGLNGNHLDNKIIEKFLEGRFSCNLEIRMKEVFNVTMNDLQTKLIFNETEFHHKDLFVNQRYGNYINSQLNELLKVFNTPIKYSQKYHILYENYIKVCNYNTPSYCERWEIIKPVLEVKTPFEFFMRKMRRTLEDNRSQLYYWDNFLIYDTIVKNNFNKKII